MAINCSARESHYSERHYFCNIFFRFVSNEIQLQKIVDRSRFKITFYKRKRLLNERIRDHITRTLKLICMSNCREYDRVAFEFVRKFEFLKTDRPMFGAPSSCLN